jgi:hypothetical protein
MLISQMIRELDAQEEEKRRALMGAQALDDDGFQRTVYGLEPKKLSRRRELMKILRADPSMRPLLKFSKIGTVTEET